MGSDPYKSNKANITIKRGTFFFFFSFQVHIKVTFILYCSLSVQEHYIHWKD